MSIWSNSKRSDRIHITYIYIIWKHPTKENISPDSEILRSLCYIIITIIIRFISQNGIWEVIVWKISICRTDRPRVHLYICYVIKQLERTYFLYLYDSLRESSPVVWLHKVCFKLYIAHSRISKETEKIIILCTLRIRNIV